MSYIDEAFAEAQAALLQCPDRASVRAIMQTLRTRVETITAQEAEPAPIDMVLHCPACGLQHIDAAVSGAMVQVPTSLGLTGMATSFQWKEGWPNPPHRSHLCHGCNHIWRPADVPTNGVAAVKTKGKTDSPFASRAPAA